mgnify:CR=1 FL=1
MNNDHNKKSNSKLSFEEKLIYIVNMVRKRLGSTSKIYMLTGSNVLFLKDNMDKLHAMADSLIQYETIGEEQIQDIMEGKTPRKPGTKPRKPRKTVSDSTETRAVFTEDTPNINQTANEQQ